MIDDQKSKAMVQLERLTQLITSGFVTFDFHLPIPTHIKIYTSDTETSKPVAICKHGA
jgi:hypothetical protein